ncbi:MAG: cysteine--tRNA ligase [Lachnospiraceae bacterium]|nr:cysteine--tRNA ligase [Lachnospiraceae bacterium]
MFKIYNTLTKKVEEFIPNVEGKVAMYTCGPTVYHYAHIGNLRSYICEDVLEKTLRYVGYDVKRVMNITDVGHLSGDSDDGEDKMVKGAQREHKTVMEIAKFYTDAFFDDCRKLNIKRPDVVEPATNCIDEFIHMIEVLLEKGYAYKAGENVYFDTSKLDEYFRFGNQNEEELYVGVRDDVTEDENKRNKNDFVLWFTKSKFEDQALKWDSPWGVGYPGWHIECSCISMKHLGEYMDIHCGGVDNIFPHHTNEIAQSESYLGHKWCNYWFHVHHLNDREGKISKSKGTLLTVSLLEEKGYDPLIYRFFCLQSHYRKPLEFSWDALDNTKAAFDKLKARVNAIAEEAVSAGKAVKTEITGTGNGSDTQSGENTRKFIYKVNENAADGAVFDEYRQKFSDALSADINTSTAITVLYDVLKADTDAATKLALITSFDEVLGLDLSVVAEAEGSGVDAELEKYILEQIELRKAAKKEKNFAEADRIRAELLEKGIVLEDTREGVKWHLA